VNSPKFGVFERCRRDSCARGLARGAYKASREPLTFDVVKTRVLARRVALDNDPYGGERNVPRLKDLAERLLDYDYHVEVDSDKPQLFLGELPTDLPAEIPVPEGMVLLGGLRRVRPWGGRDRFAGHPGGRGGAGGRLRCFPRAPGEI
jgi:hypothetical protein